MAAMGVWRMWGSEYFQKTVWPAFKAKYSTDAAKVEKVAKANGNTTGIPSPKSDFARGIYEEMRAHQIATSPPPPPPPPPPPAQPWDSGYAPRAYNMGTRDQNCKFNVHINCTLRQDGYYVDRNGIVYQDNGLCTGGRSETPAIPQLKPSDMSDGKEPWEAYEWMGNIIGPNKENYPAASYAQ